MASGLAIISSYQCGAADIIRQGENGLLCDALDSEGLSRCMRQLSDPQLRARMGQAAHELVSTWTVSRMTDQLAALYTELLAEYKSY